MAVPVFDPENAIGTWVILSFTRTGRIISNILGGSGWGVSPGFIILAFNTRNIDENFIYIDNTPERTEINDAFRITPQVTLEDCAMGQQPTDLLDGYCKAVYSVVSRIAEISADKTATRLLALHQCNCLETAFRIEADRASTTQPLVENFSKLAWMSLVDGIIPASVLSENTRSNFTVQSLMFLTGARDAQYIHSVRTALQAITQNPPACLHTLTPGEGVRRIPRGLAAGATFTMECAVLLSAMQDISDLVNR